MENITVGQSFEIDSTKEEITISDIKYIRISSGRREKLKDPVCTMSYSNGRPSFTTYISEIQRLLKFGSWKKK